LFKNTMEGEERGGVPGTVTPPGKGGELTMTTFRTEKKDQPIVRKPEDVAHLQGKRGKREEEKGTMSPSCLEGGISIPFT